MSSERVSRRGFLQAVTAGSVVATASGTAAAQEEGGSSQQPDFGSWLEGIDGGYVDGRGESEVTVEVGAAGNSGNYAFAPAGLWVDPGTTVRWEWTGEGGGHNVHAVEGADFQSETFVEAGVHFEYTFESGGIVNYQCDPHEALGMKGAVAVGEEVATVTVGGGSEGGGEVDPEHMGVPFQAHFVGVATVLSIVVSLAFTFFFLKYGETPHSGYPEED